jgi:hypothetical protein
MSPEISRMSGNIAATRGAATGRPLDILLWCVQAFLALVFVNASWAKLMGNPEMVALFTAVGVGQWLRYVTGILELTGAVLIMVPKTRNVDIFKGTGYVAVVMANYGDAGQPVVDKIRSLVRARTTPTAQ